MRPRKGWPFQNERNVFQSFGGRAVGFQGVPRFFQSSIFPANKKDENISVQPLDIFWWV